jgi:hypothetical protein
MPVNGVPRNTVLWANSQRAPVILRDNHLVIWGHSFPAASSASFIALLLNSWLFIELIRYVITDRTALKS